MLQAILDPLAMIRLLVVAVLLVAGGIFFLRSTVPPVADREADPTVTAPVEDYRDRLNEAVERGAARSRNLDPSDPNRDR